MKTRLIRSASALLLALSLAAAPGCMSGASSTELPVIPAPAADVPVESAMTVAEATAIAETALTGLNEGDYAMFTTAWRADMLAAIGPAQFEQTRRAVQDQAGAFVAIRAVRVTPGRSEGTVRFWFVCEFERGELVYVNAYTTDGVEIIGSGIGTPS